MFRIAIIALIIYLVWSLLRRLTGLRQSSKALSKKPDAPAEMVACMRCGTFIVKSEALGHRGNHFCSEKCIKTN
ncbi:MAG: PP0621 family protein [Pseudomonadota bacterium]